MATATEYGQHRQRLTSFSVADILGLQNPKSEVTLTTKQLRDPADRIFRIQTVHPTDYKEMRSKIRCTSPVSKQSKKERKKGQSFRKCFTAEQVEELERMFQDTNYPDTHTRQQMAAKMEASEARIQIWFQNRRAKVRRQRRMQNKDINSNSFAFDIPMGFSHASQVLPLMYLSKKHSDYYGQSGYYNSYRDCSHLPVSCNSYKS